MKSTESIDRQGFAPREAYACNNNQHSCSKNITYDDWHCNNCKCQGLSGMDKVLMEIEARQIDGRRNELRRFDTR